MKTTGLLLLSWILMVEPHLTAAPEVPVESAADAKPPGAGNREIRVVSGWAVHIQRELLTAEKLTATDRALVLLKTQLDEILRVVPAKAVVELKKVPLYFSSPYAEKGSRAEYHPAAAWLRDHGRDPAMAKGVEFTNIADFDAETRRMPNFTLHELAHAYHDRFLPNGFENPALKAAYAQARAGGKYERVERRDSEGRPHLDRAYALTNPQEYFAECSEAFFSRNDFYPYTRPDLEKQDPEMVLLLEKLWGM